MPSYTIGATVDWAEGSMRAVTVAGRRIAVFRADGSFYAIDDRCSHAEAWLSEGTFDADEMCVECPRHGSLFDIRSGAALTLPAFKPVATYPVRVEGDRLVLELPE